MKYRSGSARKAILAVLSVALVVVLGLICFQAGSMSTKKSNEIALFASADDSDENKVDTEKKTVSETKTEETEPEETKPEETETPQTVIPVYLPDRQKMFEEEPHFTDDNRVIITEDVDFTAEEIETMTDEELEEALEKVMEENPTVEVIDPTTGETETYVVEAVRVEPETIIALIEEANARRFEENENKDEEDTKSDVGRSLADQAEELKPVEVVEILEKDEDVTGVVTEHIQAVEVPADEDEDEEPELIVNVTIEESKKDIAKVYSPSGRMTEVELANGWSRVYLGSENGEWTINIYSWIDGRYQFVHQFTEWVGPRPEDEKPVDEPIVEPEPELEEPTVERITDEPSAPAAPADSNPDDAYGIGDDAEPHVEERVEAGDDFSDWF